MNEYIFFDAGLSDRFVAFLAVRGIAGQVRPDAMEGFVVTVADGVPDDVDDAIEDEYAALMAEQQRLVEESDDDGARDLMAVTVALPGGAERTVRLPAHYARRLFDHFSIEEIQGLVSAIAHSVLTPIDGPICRDR